MNEERIQALETEVGRLNQIINVLLKQNALLEKEKVKPQFPMKKQEPPFPFRNIPPQNRDWKQRSRNAQ